MKPSRIPVRAFGNATFTQPLEQRPLRPSSTQATMEPRQIVRCVSQEQKVPYQQVQYIPYQQRGPSPPIRKPLQETVAYYQQQPQVVQQKNEQIKQSFSQLSHVQSQSQLIKDDGAQQIIKSQNEQIQQLQGQLSEKVHQYQQLQDRFNGEFRKFQDEIKHKLANIDLNISMNDYTQQFMIEIDRKVQNLQNNINEQIKELNEGFELKTKQSEHLVKNLSANTSIRLNEDEAHFKAEIDNLTGKLSCKADRQKTDQIITQQINTLQGQYSLQLQQAHQLLNKINNDKSDELNTIKHQVQQTLTNLTKTVNYQLQEFHENMNDKEVDNQRIKQERKQVTQQFHLLSNKFSALQQQYNDTVKQLKQKIKTLESEKQETTKNLTQQQFLVQQLQQEITKLKASGSALSLSLSPQLKQQNSFFSTSTAAAQQKSKKQLSLLKKKNEISLDDFVDFNENSILDSNESFEINETGGFSKTKKPPTIDEFSSPPRNPFKKSQLVNINKMLNEEITGQISQKSRGKSAPVPMVNALTKAIKRRLLYLGKNDKILTCSYDSEKHLIDTDMGLCLLDENGSPFIVTEQEKNQLIQMKLIRIE